MMLEVYGENGMTALTDTIVPGEMTISKLNRWQRPLTDNHTQQMRFASIPRQNGCVIQQSAFENDNTVNDENRWKMNNRGGEE